MYLVDNTVRHSWQISLFQVHQHDSRLQTSPQIEQRMKRQRCHVRFTPAIADLIHILFVFDPARGFLPFTIVTSPSQLIQLHKDLVWTVIEMFLVRIRRCYGHIGQSAVLTTVWRLDLMATHTTRIIGPMGRQLFDISLLQIFNKFVTQNMSFSI